MRDALESDNSWAVVMAFAECVYSVSCAYTAFARIVFNRIPSNHLRNAEFVDRMAQHVGQNLHEVDDGLLLLRHY